MSAAHCQLCNSRAPRLTCAPCTQAALWPVRTEFLFLAAERDAASERVHEYLESSSSGGGGGGARAEELRVKTDEKRETYRRLNEELAGGTSTHFPIHPPLVPPVGARCRIGALMFVVFLCREGKDGETPRREPDETDETGGG